MNELFVSYEIAKLLKDKGFDVSCLAYYVNDKFRLKFYLNKEGNYNHDFQIGNLFAAPLYQQVIDWFREKHNKHIKVDDFINDIAGIEWDYEIVEIGTDLDKDGNYVPLVPYSINNKTRSGLSYYEALDKAIEEILKLI